MVFAKVNLHITTNDRCFSGTFSCFRIFFLSSDPGHTNVANAECVVVSRGFSNCKYIFTKTRLIKDNRGVIWACWFLLTFTFLATFVT